jgi:large subunit ribosomal protein L35
VCAAQRAPEELLVPKLKSHRGASKRFKLTGTGKVRRSHSLKNHILTKKTTKRKRHLRKSTLVSPAMARSVRVMIAD